MRPVHCNRPSLHAVVAAGLSILVVAIAVPLDVIVVVVVIAGAVAVAVVVVVVVVPSASRLGEPCWARTWRPLVAATLLTRAHLPPRGDIARFYCDELTPVTRIHALFGEPENRSYRTYANSDHLAAHGEDLR